MYATQASSHIFIVDQAKGIEVSRGNILKENMHCHYEDLLIEFTNEEACKLESYFQLSADKEFQRKFWVNFEVKHVCFDLLNKSMESLSPTVISKIMPTPEVDDLNDTSSILPVLQSHLHHPASYNFLELDDQSQLPALEKVINSPSQAPVIVSGAFGTGKTRLLAVATYHFIEQGKQKGVPTRVLLCCHYQTTADMFINEYFGKMVEDKSHPWRVKLVRLIPSKWANRKSCSYDLKYWQEYTQENYMVIVSTFLTGFLLRQVVDENFITHILLDEAAQVTEPQAVAPLCMAMQQKHKDCHCWR